VGAAVLNVLWSSAIQPIYSSMIVDNDVHTQMDVVKTYPLQVLELIRINLAEFWPDYLRTMIGVLGWIDAYMPVWIVPTFVCFLLLAGLSSSDLRPSLSVVERVVFIGLAAGTVVSVALGIYLSGMPTGIQTLLGIQGRYFLPIVPLVLIAITPRATSDSRWQTHALPALSMMMAILSYVLIAVTEIQRYY